MNKYIWILLLLILTMFNVWSGFELITCNRKCLILEDRIQTLSFAYEENFSSVMNALKFQFFLNHQILDGFELLSYDGDSITASDFSFPVPIVYFPRNTCPSCYESFFVSISLMNRQVSDRFIFIVDQDIIEELLPFFRVNNISVMNIYKSLNDSFFEVAVNARCVFLINENQVVHDSFVVLKSTPDLVHQYLNYLEKIFDGIN